MDKDIDIIMLPSPLWDAPYSSTSFSLAKELAETNRVFYLDNPFTLKHILKDFNKPLIKKRIPALIFGKSPYRNIPGASKNFIAVTPGIVIPVNFLNAGMLYNFISKYNDKVIYHSIKKLLKDYDLKKYIFINSFNPFYALDIRKNFNPLLNIYQTVDDLRTGKRLSKHGVRLEKIAVENADFTLTTSKELYRLKLEQSKNVYYLPNAADISLFSKTIHEKFEKPQDIAHITTKIIGYVGNIYKRIDYSLLKKIATAHPDKTLLMVGPSTHNEYLDYDVHTLPNVIFTGPKPMEMLPAYLQHIDCAIIPFLCSTLTKSIYPLKINEYLAAGKSVVTTDFSEDIRDFSEVIQLAKNEEDFIQKINIALQQNDLIDIKKRYDIAQTNTWNARAIRLKEIISDNLKNK